jgi:hypothetical protein
MQQPKFTRWPWGVLALTTPALAAGAALAHLLNDSASQHLPTEERIWIAGTVFFGVLGAANGYLIGIAIGDLGRSALALPLGAAIALGATYGLHFQVVAVAVIILFAAIMLNAVVNGLKILSGCAATMLLMVVLMGIIAAEGEGARPVNLLLTYPLICSFVTASMPLERSVDGLFGAFLVGARASLFGMLPGLLAFCLTMSLITLIDFLLPGSMLGGTVGPVGPALCATTVGAMAANVYCMKLLFDAVYRVSNSDEEHFHEVPVTVTHEAPPADPAPPADA